MSTKIQSKHAPTGNVFDTGRLPPSDTAQSLAVWKNFIQKQLPLLRTLETRSFSSVSDRQIVCLLEKRSPYLEFVMLNSRVMLGDDWGFQLVTSPALAHWAEEFTKVCSGVKIHPVLKTGVNVNKLKRRVDFWNQIAGEYLLMLDTESIICHGGIDEFLEYDYVAALWRQEDVSPWCSFGSGISLRRKSVMIKICSECNTNPLLIPDESIFISMMLRLQSDHYHLPDDLVASHFAVERCYNNRPFALHKTWQFIQHKQLSEILGTIEVADQAVRNDMKLD
ncbi:MAG: hypothetical protein BMS9Abin25_0258 [Gammaproteobacteria bacterium]|nr:MAG: hypothetical protein BMS9Abin25_0258 [Gammaproteobacteria bacterium]